MGSGGQDHTSQDHFCSVMDEFPVWNSETKQSCDDERSFSSWARGCDVAVCCIASMTAWTGAGSVWAVANLHACNVFFPRIGTARRDCSYECNFAQWRYSNQWSNREVLLLLVENYNQYPALDLWNINSWGNLWTLRSEQHNKLILLSNKRISPSPRQRKNKVMFRAN